VALPALTVVSTASEVLSHAFDGWKYHAKTDGLRELSRCRKVSVSTEGSALVPCHAFLVDAYRNSFLYDAFSSWKRQQMQWRAVVGPGSSMERKSKKLCFGFAEKGFYKRRDSCQYLHARGDDIGEWDRRA